MGESNKIFRFVFDNQMIAFGSIIGQFGSVNGLEDVRKEIMAKDFIIIEGVEVKTLIATKHIKAVEEV